MSKFNENEKINNIHLNNTLFKENIESPLNISFAFNSEYNSNKQMKDTVLDNHIKQSFNKNNFEKSQNYEDQLSNSFFIFSENYNSFMENLDKSFSEKNNYEQVEFLKQRPIKNITDDYFNQHLKKFNLGKMKEITQKILNYKLNPKIYSETNIIGPCIGIPFLIESTFKFKRDKINQMIEKYNNLKDFSYFRSVKGDGNCFYRSLIFKYFEIIIFNNDIILFKNLFNDLEHCFSEQKMKNLLNVLNNNNYNNLEEIFLSLIAIYVSMKEKNIKKSYKLFLNAIYAINNFDLALILLLRYILYKYIDKNKSNLYSNTFPILIGNLLPAEYESKDGEFLYEQFYDKYLLKLYTDAEKIVIYLIPFIFPIDLNIILFEGPSNQTLQEFYSKNNLNNNYLISLLNKNCHYEVLYSKKEYEKFKQYLFDYTNNNMNLLYLQNYICCQNNINQNNINNNNNTNYENPFNSINTNQFNNQKVNNSFNNPFKSLKEVNGLKNKQVKNELQLTKQLPNYQVKNQPQYPNCNYNPGYMNYNNQINNIQQNYIPKNHHNDR